MLSAIFRLTMYFGLSLSILQKEYKLDSAQTVHKDHLSGLFAIITLAGAVLYAAQVRIALLRQIMSYTVAVFGVSALLGGFAFAVFLFIFCAIKVAASLLEILLIPWSAFPWRGSVLTENKKSSTTQIPPSDAVIRGRDQVSSIDRLIWPQHILLLTCSATQMTASAHANLQALVYLSFTGVLTILAQVPVAVVMTLGVLWCMFALVLDLSLTSSANFHGQVVLALVFTMPGLLAWHLSQGRFRSRVPQGTDVAFFDGILRVKFGSLHNWFVMNRAVARSIIEQDM